MLYSHTLGIEYVCINGNSFTTGCSEHIAQFDAVKTNFMHYDCDSYYQERSFYLKDLFNIIVNKQQLGYCVHSEV